MGRWWNGFDRIGAAFRARNEAAGRPRNVRWITRAVVCDGAVVFEPLDPARLSDADLADLCLRMLVIMSTIESPRAEGRWLPVELHDQIDTLWSMVCQGHPGPSGYRNPPGLDDWMPLVEEFGAYYGLNESGRIRVDPQIYRDEVDRFAKSRPPRPS
jgi:hypothetical protein